MISSDSLCMGCMRNIGGEKKCPHCGFVQDTMQPEPYLPIRTCLVNRYLVGRLLDCDGEGATYIGWDLSNRTAVDIREFIPDKFTTRMGGRPGLQVMMGSESAFLELKGNFIELWTRLARLRGIPALIQVTDIFEEFGTAYAVYEHIDGISLGDFLLRSKTGNMPWEKAKQLLMPSLATLGTLHQNGIIHRGISPSTLIIGEDGKIRITGFATGDLRTLGSRINPKLYDGYAAVEQYGREFRQGPWTDVYAFGAVMYRTLIGMDPLSARERMNDDRLAIPGKFREQIPGYVINCLVDSLQLLPKERVNSIDAVRAALSTQAPAAQTQAYQAPVPQTRAPAPAPQRNAAANYDYGTDYVNESREKKKDSPSLIIVKTVLIVLLVCAVMFGIVMLVIHRDTIFNGDDDSTVSNATTEAQEGYINIPNLIGKNESSASTVCKQDGLQIKVVEQEVDDESKIGYVFSQEPAYDSNKSIKKGTQITVYIGKAKEEATGFKFPNVLGMNYEEARAQLEDLGLEVDIKFSGQYDKERYGNYEADEVYYTTKSAGASAKAGEQVTLYVYQPDEDETEPAAEEEITTAPAEEEPTTEAATEESEYDASTVANGDTEP